MKLVWKKTINNLYYSEPSQSITFYVCKNSGLVQCYKNGGYLYQQDGKRILSVANDHPLSNYEVRKWKKHCEEIWNGIINGEILLSDKIAIVTVLEQDDLYNIDNIRKFLVNGDSLNLEEIGNQLIKFGIEYLNHDCD